MSITVSNFKTYSKETVIRGHDIGTQIDRLPDEWERMESRNRSIYVWVIDFQQRRNELIGEQIGFSTNGA